MFRKGFLHFIGEGEIGACCHFPEFSVVRADTECLSISSASTIGCGSFLRVLRVNVVNILCICLFLAIQIRHKHINTEKMNTLQIKFLWNPCPQISSLPIPHPAPLEKWSHIFNFIYMSPNLLLMDFYTYVCTYIKYVVLLVCHNGVTVYHIYNSVISSHPHLSIYLRAFSKLLIPLPY